MPKKTLDLNPFTPKTVVTRGVFIHWNVLYSHPAEENWERQWLNGRKWFMVCMHKFYTRPCPTLLISSFWRPAAFRTVSTGNKHCSNRLELSDSKRALQTKQRKNHIKGKGKKKPALEVFLFAFKQDLFVRWTGSRKKVTPLPPKSFFPWPSPRTNLAWKWMGTPAMQATRQVPRSTFLWGENEWDCKTRGHFSKEQPHQSRITVSPIIISLSN